MKRAIVMALSVILALAVAVPLAFGQDLGSTKGDKNSKIAFTQLRKDINNPNCGVEGNFPGYTCDATFADEHQNAEIWVMDDADGTELRQLTHNTTFDLGAVWSPDGNTIAFYGTQNDGDGQPVLAPRIFVIPADSTDGSEQQALTPLIGDENIDGNLSTADCDTVDPEQTMPCGAQWPSWSPSGDMIAFNDRRNWIWVMDVADTNEDGKLESSNLTKLSSQALRPDWNSNGNQIAFQSGRLDPVDNTRDPDIWVMDVADTNGDGTLESSNSINLTANLINRTGKPSGEQVPNLSPDNSRIVFHSDRDHPGETFQFEDGVANLNEIYVMDLTLDDEGNITGVSKTADGTARPPTRLTKCTWDPVKETCAEPAGSPRNLDPDWSPNGKEIAFHKHVTLDDPPYSIRLTDSVLETFVMDAKDDETILADESIVAGPDGEGDNLKQLTQLPSENGHAGWGPS